MHHPLHRFDRSNSHCQQRPSALGRGGLAAALMLALIATDATAALSRWSASNNRIYVYGGGTMTLTDISSTTPSLPADKLQRVDPANNIWLLSANILVEDGTTLLLTSADITELRLQSNPSSAPLTDVTNFVSITAGNFDAGSETAGAGTIKVDGIKVTSWAGSGPDTTSADGRAFLRARSAVLNGVAEVSRMDILNSEIQYLGFDASERYGLSWKANGDLAALDVLGDVKNSKIHHNHYGVYSFGLQGGQWTGNELYSNDGYGFDAHDHSDDLVIDGNNVHDNGHVDAKGKHGIILSESCLRAQITNNTSNGNFGNGIMLHDFADDAIVEGNTASGNGDAGVAVFCSNKALVKNNTLSGNALYGIRLTVGSTQNNIEGNTIDGSGQYGVFMQPATDSNGICGDLTPRGNTFTGNTISGSGTSGVKITDANDNTFVGNTINDGVSVRNANATTEQVVAFRENTFGPGVVVRLDGAADRPLRGNFTKTPHVSLEVDTGSVVSFTDDAGAIFDLLRDLMVTVNGSASSIDLHADNAGPAFEVDTRPLFVTTDGSVVQVAPTLWETSGDFRKSWIARADNGSGTVDYRVGDLQQGTSYDVKRGDVDVGAFVADEAGQIAFADVPASTETLTYNLTRSAVQPQGGGGGGGAVAGGGGALDFLLLALLAAGGLVRGRNSWWWRRTA